MADCLVAALGRDDVEEEQERVRAYVGAIHLAEGLLELRTLREILVKALSS